jgi:dihydroorotate dehydrogenase (NAD+) catalytic subunit
MSTTRLATSLCGITLRSPVLAAAGTFAYGTELQGLLDWNWVGGIVVKGLRAIPPLGFGKRH